MNGWRSVALGELCDRVTVGHVGKMADEYVDTGVPFLRSQDIKPFTIREEGLLRIGSDFHRRLSKSILKAGDVVVVRTGYPGTAAVVPAHLDGANCADLVIVTPSNELNPHVLAGVFNSKWGRAAVAGNLVGSAQQHFNVGSAKRLRIRLPDRRTQDGIAHVLCAFHDLLENNRRRIELLEKIAQTIYNEWFVHFHYPGHENNELVESPLGRIPQDWDILAANEAVSINPKVSAPKDTGVPFVAMADVSERSMLVAPSATRAFGGGGSRFARHDTLFARITPCTENGKTGFVQFLGANDVAKGSTEFIVIRQKRLSPFSTYLLARRNDFRQHAIGSMAGASGRQRVNNSCFRTFFLPVAPRRIEDQFSKVVEPMFTACETHAKEAGRLASIRDLMLPRLITGQIDVSKLDFDAALEEVAG